MRAKTLFVVAALFGATALATPTMAQPNSTGMTGFGTAQTTFTLVSDGRCVPQHILCSAGTHYSCNHCVADSQCVPQRVMCASGTHYSCNHCVRN